MGHAADLCRAVDGRGVDEASAETRTAHSVVLGLPPATAPFSGCSNVTGHHNHLQVAHYFRLGRPEGPRRRHSEALITTEFGAESWAIPSLILHAFLLRKARGHRRMNSRDAMTCSTVILAARKETGGLSERYLTLVSTWCGNNRTEFHRNLGRGVALIIALACLRSSILRAAILQPCFT